MRKLITFLTALLLFAGAMPAIADEAPEGGNGPYPIWLSPGSPVDSLDGIDEAWSRPFLDGIVSRVFIDHDENRYHDWLFTKGEGPDKKSAIAVNCDSLFDLEGQSYTASPGDDWPFYDEQRNICDFLDRLRSAKPATRSYVRDLHLTKQSVDIFPAFFGLGLSCDMKCRYAEADRKAIPVSKFWLLSDIYPRFPERLAYSEGDANYLVSLLAKGDFDGDGLEDILVNRSYYYSLVGRHTGNKNFVLTRDRPGTVLRVTDLDSHLCLRDQYQCNESHSDLSRWLDVPR